MRDIILVMSDQHNGSYISLQQDWISTPNLERIAQAGRYYPHAYCNAPLCVPSRMSFLSGYYPSELQIFNNDTTLPVDMPTLAHSLGTAGYHTVLIGRMHFKGEEQHHGFDERLVGDITSQYWGTGGKQRTDFETYMQTTNHKHCLEAVGGGISPVMVYDQMVFEEAMRYMKQPHTKPIFLVVGFYSPHFPYTCQSSLFEHYQQCLRITSSQISAHPYYRDLVQEADETLIRDCKASYAGSIETLDTYIGALFDTCFQQYQQPVFLYTSDHGEQCGKRQLFGKQTLYEDAIHIPLFIAGTDIPQGVDTQCVDLLDVRKTICLLAGCEDHVAGESLLQKKQQKWIRCEAITDLCEQPIFGQAVILWPYKLVLLHDDLRLFDLSKDPQEEKDVSHRYPELVTQLASHFVSEAKREECLKQEARQRLRHHQLQLWGRKKRPLEPSSVQIPPDTLQAPKR